MRESIMRPGVHSCLFLPNMVGRCGVIGPYRLPYRQTGKSTEQVTMTESAQLVEMDIRTIYVRVVS